MPPKPPSLYDLNKTTIAFSMASIVLLVGLVAMVMQDSTREWKKWQREFMEYNHEKAEEELHKAEKEVDAKKVDALKDQLKEAQAQLGSHKTETEKIKADLAKIDLESTQAKVRYQNLKQEQDSDRYFFEEARAHQEKEKTEKYEKRLHEREPLFQKAKLDFEAVEARRDERNKALLQFTEASQKLSKDIAKANQDVTLIEKKVVKFAPDWKRAILNAPMLDFIRPSLQIQQIVVENLFDDYYFNKTQKVDRCITCHLSIDQKGFENAPGPFKAHPRLDLFLSSNSPHPMEKFGCTVCHGGSGHSVSFETAAHNPQNPTQAEEWKKKYQWHEMEHWSEKMLPLNHAQASCAKCHSGAVEVPEAPKLNEGRRLAQVYGCYACHKVQGVERWKVGPGLEHVQSKLEADWIVRWLQNPKEFRASTKMPRIFHLSNISDPESVEKSNAMIAGIATYLIKNSDPIALKTAPVQGKPEVGEKLVTELGCLGCHTVGTAKANEHAPDLSGLGSKVKAEWLYTWLKDPKAYHAETRMPNLRLSDEEAANIASFLLSQRNEKFESMALPHVKPEIVDSMALTFMGGTMRQEEAQAQLAKMNPDERLEFVGKKAIAHQGCFGCHNIKGFEDAKPIGTELSEEGSKDVDKLYFGFVDIEHKRHSWFFQKLKEPRIFDQGRDLSYLEKLRMPQFDFTDDQAESLVTFLLSQQKAQIPMDMKKNLNIREDQIEAGRLLVSKFHCQGCHTLDGKEGKVRSIIEDKGNAPPIINGEGAKAQPQWLYHFLAGPTPVRPWLKYRMPTFGFNEKELNTLVQYFNSLENAPPSFEGDKIAPPSPEDLATGHKLFQTFQCIKCHKSKPETGLSASFLAPNLVIAKERLRHDWVLAWLKDPQTLLPGTMMPSFFPEGQSPVQDVYGGDAAKQIKAIRDYLWVFSGEEGQANPSAPQAVAAK